MKEKSSTRKLLGINQQEMAMLLGINRSQWSMYESGLRELPLKAMILESEVTRHFSINDKVSKDLLRPTDVQRKHIQKRLEYLLNENEYQQHKLARKKAAAEKKHELLQRRLQLAEFLDHHAAKNEKGGKILHDSIISVTNTTVTASTIMLLECELKQQLLDFEKKWIESKLREVR